MVTDFAQVTTRQSASKPLKETLFNSDQVQLPDDERSPCTTESSKTSSMMTTGAKGDDDLCGVNRPTLSTS